MTEAVLEKVTALAKIEYPPAAVEEEVDNLIRELERRLLDRGLTLQGYLEAEGKSMEELRAEQRPAAEERIKRSLVLQEIIKREGIEVTEEEISGEVETIAELYGSNADDVRKALSTEGSRRSLESRLLVQKAIDRLIEIATSDESEDEAPPTPESEATNAES